LFQNAVLEKNKKTLRIPKKNSKKIPGNKRIPEKTPLKNFKDFFKKILKRRLKNSPQKFSEVDQGLAGMSPLVDG
jgi:hypothetical protein